MHYICFFKYSLGTIKLKLCILCDNFKFSIWIYYCIRWDKIQLYLISRICKIFHTRIIRFIRFAIQNLQDLYFIKWSLCSAFLIYFWFCWLILIQYFDSKLMHSLRTFRNLKYLILFELIILAFFKLFLISINYISAWHTYYHGWII